MPIEAGTSRTGRSNGDQRPRFVMYRRWEGVSGDPEPRREDDEERSGYRGAGEVTPSTPPAMRRYGVAGAPQGVGACLDRPGRACLFSRGPFFFWVPGV